MALRPDQIADIVTATLREFPRNAWTDISLDLQDYIAMSSLLQSHKVGFTGGEQLEWQVKVQNTGNASNTGLYDTDEVSVLDVLKTCNVPWSFQKTYFAYDEREPAFQGSWHRIVDIVKVRRHAALNDLAELMETNFFSRPANASDQSELLKPYGLPYWVVGENATTTFGFNGSNPNGHTTTAGLDADTYTNWKNGNATYSVISKTDLVRLWREAAVKCRFKPPVEYPDVATGARYAYLTTYNVLGTLEELLEDQNDNLGNDVASKDGKTMFRGTPVSWAPYLDAHTFVDNTTSITDPVYGIDWGTFQCVFKSGEFMKESKPTTAPNQHRVKNVFIDTMAQYRCTDRRRNFVLFQA